MYLFISLIVLTLSYLIFKKVSGSLSINQLNMISWVFYYNLIIQSFIASILVVYSIDHHYILSKIHNENVRFYGWLAVQYTMIAMPLGMLFVVNLFGYKNNNKLFQNYVKSNMQPLMSAKDSYIRYPFYLLSIISVLSVIYVMISLKSIPLIGIVQGLGAEALGLLRIKASRNFSGNIYIRNVFALGLTPILSYVAYGYFKMTKSKKDLMIFIILFIASFFILTYNIAKSPFVQYLIGFLFLNILINGSVSKKFLILAFTVVISLILGMYIIICSVTDFTELFSYNTGIVGRIILSQASGTYISFDIFPTMHPFIGFASVSNFLNSIFDIQTIERAARLNMEYINPKGVAAGIAGVANSLFIGEAWANFGLLGVLIAPFYVGMVIQTLFMFFIKSPKTPILLALFTYFSYKGSVTGGFNDYFYNAGNFIIAIIFVWIYFSGLIFKQIKEKRFEKNNISPSITN